MSLFTFAGGVEVLSYQGLGITYFLTVGGKTVRQMAGEDEVSDEYVAQLLAKDAKDLAKRSSRLGRYDPFLQRLARPRSVCV